MKYYKTLIRKVKKIPLSIKEGTFFNRLLRNIKEAKRSTIGNIRLYFRKCLFNNTEIEKNKILFCTFQNTYTCNPKYICEEILRRNIDLKIVWGIKEYSDTVKYPNNERIKYCLLNSKEYYREAASAKMIITNSFLGSQYNLFPTKKEQIVIQTWHGSLGIKRIDSKHYKSSSSWVKQMKYSAVRTSYCISNSYFENSVYLQSFWNNRQIIKLGHARNDIFFNEKYVDSKKERKNFINKYSLKEDIKFVLYAPTFRDDHSFNNYNLDYDVLISALSKRFGGNWHILVRFHPTVLKESKDLCYKNEKIIDVTDISDIQTLLSFVDVGITDYSSWIFDYMLSRKPAFIYSNDIESYKKERGFYYNIYETPFTVSTNNSELESNILNFDYNRYKKDILSFLFEKGCIDDGNSSERIVDFIIEKLNL